MTSYLRYKQELRTVQDADDIESWITVRGNHIPIKKGQSKEEAVKSFLEKKGSSPKTRESAKQRNENFEKAKQTLPAEKQEVYLNKIGEINKKYDRLHAEASTKEEKAKIDKEWSKQGREVVKEMTGAAKTESKQESKKTEFEQTFGNSSWNAHKDWASYVDNDYRIEVIKENGKYYISKFDIDDYDGSDPEMEEYADTIEEAKQVAEKMINKSQPLSKEEKITKAQKVRDLMNSSIRFEKEGKKFRITGLYSGGEVELDFEKLTGQSPNQSVEYRVKDGVLHINDYYGHWHKEIDFSELDDDEIADMIIK